MSFENMSLSQFTWGLISFQVRQKQYIEDYFINSHLMDSGYLSCLPFQFPYSFVHQNVNSRNRASFSAQIVRYNCGAPKGDYHSSIKKAHPEYQTSSFF